MIDLERQLRDVAGHLDELVANIDVEQVLARQTRAHFETYSQAPAPLFGRKWVAAVTAMILVIAGVGLFLSLRRGNERGAVVTNPPGPESAMILGLPAGSPPPFVAQLKVTVPNGFFEQSAESEDTEDESSAPAAANESSELRAFTVSLSADGFRFEDGTNYYLHDGVWVEYSIGGDLGHEFMPGARSGLTWGTWGPACEKGRRNALGEKIVAGQRATGMECVTLSGTRQLWIDQETGVILEARGQMQSSAFSAILTVLIDGWEVESIDYTPVFPERVFDMVEEPVRADLPAYHRQQGKAAPPLTGQDLSGNEFNLASLRGKRTVLLWWASWCEPCLVALEDFERFATEHGGDVEFVAVAFRDDAGDVRRLVENHPVDSTVVMPDLDLESEEWGSDEWGVEGIPSIYLLNREGVVLDVHFGLGDLAQILERAGW